MKNNKEWKLAEETFPDAVSEVTMMKVVHIIEDAVKTFKTGEMSIKTEQAQVDSIFAQFQKV